MADMQYPQSGHSFLVGEVTRLSENMAVAIDLLVQKDIQMAEKDKRIADLEAAASKKKK